MKRIPFIMLMLIVSAIALAVDAAFVSATGVSLAVVGGTWTDQMQIFRRGLSKQMEKLVWRYGKWAELTDIVDVKKYRAAGTYAGAMSLPTPKNLIHVVKDFEREGGIYMDIPVLVPLTAKGKVGLATLRGNEEKRKILTKKVAINQVRHAVEIQDNKMSKQVLKKPQVVMALMERGKNDLQDWFSRRMAQFPYHALMGGFSNNLTDPVDGIGFTVKSHPNQYVAGFGKVAFANLFDAAYETATSNALATLSDVPDKHFSLDKIKNMVYLANFHKLTPLMIQGKLLYLIFIPPALAWQLKQDSEYLTYLKDAGVRGNENIIFTGQLEGTYIEGAFLVVDDTMPAARISGDTGYDATWGTVNYGLDTYMANPRDEGSRKAALICGAGAITAGYGSELAFESEDADYKQFLGDSADMITGFERCDIIDDDNYFGNGAGAFYENNSSLIYWFYADDALTSI
jgi:hypothetical protein